VSVVLFCNCAYAGIIAPRIRQPLLQALTTAADVELVAVADLCELAARRDPRLQACAESAKLTVVACFPRAVRGLFAAAGAPLPREGVTFVNMRAAGSAEELLRQLPIPGSDHSRPQVPPAPVPAAGAWIPWFPVIDRERCRNCKQCLSFCLFGVYALGENGRVEVRNPQKCKTNCPACARICPEIAIMFPKYTEAPITGAEVADEQVERQKVKVNVQKMLGDDVYAALARRRQQARLRLLKRPPGVKD